MSATDAEKAKFHAGDVVRLVAGGPDMTVQGYAKGWNPSGIASDVVTCRWFEKVGGEWSDLKSNAFFECELVKV